MPAASASTLTLGGRYAFDRTRLFDEKIQPEDQLLIDRLFPQRAAVHVHRVGAPRLA